jgi:hypothetical protein
MYHLLYLLDPYLFYKSSLPIPVVGVYILFRHLFCVYCVWLGCLSALPPPPPTPLAPVACCTQLACGQAFPLVSPAHPSLYSIRQGAENSPAIPPVADSWYFALYPRIARLFNAVSWIRNKYFYCFLLFLPKPYRNKNYGYAEQKHSLIILVNPFLITLQTTFDSCMPKKTCQSLTPKYQQFFILFWLELWTLLDADIQLLAQGTIFC